MFTTRHLRGLKSICFKHCEFPSLYKYSEKKLGCSKAYFASKGDGVDIDDADQLDAVEKALAAEKYNKLFFNLNQQLFSKNKSTDQFEILDDDGIDLDSAEEIDSYEQLYMDSYIEHAKQSNIKVEGEIGKRELSKEFCPLVEGQLWVGGAGKDVIKGSRVLEQAETAASLIAKRSGDLVVEHFPNSSSKLTIVVHLDDESAEVLVSVGVEGEEQKRGDVRTEAYTACAIALANVYHALKDQLPKDSMTSIKLANY